MRKQTPEPSTEIIGSPDVYIESGSTINLTCVIEDSPEPPAYIFWNHNSAVSIQSVQCSICFCLHDVFIMMSKLLLMFVLFQWKNKAKFLPINNLIHRFHSYTFVCLYLYRAICLCSYFSPVLHALTLKATLNHQSVYSSGWNNRYLFFAALEKHGLWKSIIHENQLILAAVGGIDFKLAICNNVFFRVFKSICKNFAIIAILITPSCKKKLDFIEIKQAL